MVDMTEVLDGREVVVVSNRLPVDRVTEADGTTGWRTSPGGLVTAVEPIVSELGCVWIGWPGDADEEVEPFRIGSMRLVPVSLSSEEIEEYYEGFSNGTLWPLYHDVTAQPRYQREWWERYRDVNRRFAETVAREAPEGALVWVHDYQLQLVPGMLRDMRPDLAIGFFLHIPFPGSNLFSQLPWRKEIVEGLLGADVIGFQRVEDAVGFRAVAERLAEAPAHANRILLPGTPTEPSRAVLAQEFPISIDFDTFAEIAARPEVQHRARRIREDLGDPGTVLLGVDRLDYTKGIRHRLRAYGELLAEETPDAVDSVLVQVASPSREQVSAYRRLRDDVEVTVGRINGDYGTIGRTPIVYLHQSFSREDMVALYLAADVLVITALRDGMNLVAKEYVACRADEQGVLLLSEFTGAADELTQALLVNPHDIEGLKAAFLRAIHMPENEQRRRMREMRRSVRENGVVRWADGFLRAVVSVADQGAHRAGADDTGFVAAGAVAGDAVVPEAIAASLRRFAASPELIIACDFDGTLAPIVSRPSDARILPRAQRALEVLSRANGVEVVLLTGRSLAGLRETGIRVDGWIVSGSHGAEMEGDALGGLAAGEEESRLSEDEARVLDALRRRLARVFGRERGVRLEDKPFGVGIHTREVRDPEHASELLEAASRFAVEAGLQVREGKQVREFSVRSSDKGTALQRIRSLRPEAPVLFLGDDKTDEDVFATLRSDDLGIKVGPGDTRAQERVATPATVASILARLAEFRTGVVIGFDPEG